MDIIRYKKILLRILLKKYYIREQLLMHFARLFSDRKYLELIFPMRTGYKLNLDNPQTYNEKLQWLKLYDRNPAYPKMVDKYEAKKYVAEIIGEEHIIPTLGIYNNVDEIDFSKLPNQFVLKCTHDSGGIVVCKDKNKLDLEEAKKKLARGIRKNYYKTNREWPYKNVHPRIIAEQYMEDPKSHELSDYKWFCFNGEPKAMFIATDRFTPGVETKFDFFDMEFNHLPFTNGHPNTSIPIQKPEGFEEMKELARKLSKNIPHARIDFYDINGKIYFGEITFFHWSGMKPFKPVEWDYTFGSWIKLPTQKHQ